MIRILEAPQVVARRKAKALGPVATILQWFHYPAIEDTSLNRSDDMRAGADSDYGQSLI